MPLGFSGLVIGSIVIVDQEVPRSIRGASTT